MSDLNTKEHMDRLRKQFRALGFLQKPANKDWMGEIEVFGWRFIMAANWGGECWETFKASGSVYVNYFALQRMVELQEEGDHLLLTGWQLLFGPLRLNWACMKVGE